MAGIFGYTSIVAEQTWFLPGEPAHFDPVATFGSDPEACRGRARGS